MAARTSAAKSAHVEAAVLDFDQRNPHYRDREAVWAWNKAHWDGGRALVAGGDSFLPKFQLENQENYDRRKFRAGRMYHNLVRSAVQVYVSQLFRRDPERDIPEEWKEFVDDVDMQGTKANRFFRDTARMAMRDGICGVLIESPANIDPDTSEADAQELRLRPWFERIEASRVVDWDVDRTGVSRGKLNWIVIKDETTEARLPFGQTKSVTRYRVYTRESITFYETSMSDKGKVEGGVTFTAPNSIGEVPFVPFYDEMRSPMHGETIIDDVALIANALWNSTSVADEAYHYQGFSLLTIISDAEMSELKVGEDRGLKLPAGSEAFYLSPSAVPFEAHDKRARDMIERVTDLVFQRTSRQLPTAQVESAEKREVDREEFIALLEERAAGLEASETACWRIFAKYQQTADAAVESIAVIYNRKFKANARAVADWKDLVTQGIYSRVDWYIEEHPGTAPDDALTKIEENLQAEKDMSPMAAADAAGMDAADNAFAALDENPDEAVDPDAELVEEGEEDEAKKPPPFAKKKAAFEKRSESPF